MKNIKTLPNGYQVVMVDNRKEYSRFFSYSKGKRKARNDAEAYRDSLITILKKNTFSYRSSKSSSNTSVMGVSRCCCLNRRRGIFYISYSAHFIDDRTGKPNNKTFFVGRENTVTQADEDIALKLAIKFRREWENSFKEKGN